MIEIKAVIRRSDQGVTRPFVCRDENGNQLWVKGSAWLPKDLVAEWMRAQLAEEWGLPVAKYSLVMVEKNLIEYSLISDISSLGAGIGFGSFNVDGSIELNYGDIERIDTVLCADILLFDYWIHNTDRILGENGGNPNLLWIPRDNKVVMIDHNSAFDAEFSLENFFGYHIFADSRVVWTNEYIEKMNKKLLAILKKLPNIVNSLPEEWLDDDDIRPKPLREEVERIINVLRRIENDPKFFWEVNA